MTNKLNGLASLLLLLSVSFNAHSQEEIEGNNAAATDDEEIELINITGSRILEKNDIDILPLTIFTGAELQNRGYVSLGELVRDLTFNNTSSFDPYLNPMGIAAFELRGLGVESTLTLLNGHRVAPVGLTAKGIDVSVIPVSIIERVEILKDGASALYGADAIAGVVNIILKKDFYGGDVNTSVSTNSEGSSTESALSLSYGTYLTDDLGVTGYVYFSHRDDYDFAESNWLQEANQIPNGGADLGINFAEIHARAFLYDEFRFAISPTCPTEPGGDYIIDTDETFFSNDDEFCRRIFFNPDHTILPKQNAFSTLWQFDYSISLDTSWYFEVALNNRSSYKKFDVGRITCCDNSYGLFGAPFVPASHPDNVFGQDLGLFWRVGNQNYWTNTDVDTLRVLTGLKGFIGQANWEISAYNAYNDSDRIFGYRIITDELQKALLGMGGSNGDQFLNPFGGTNSDDVLDQIFTDVFYRSKYTDRGVEAYINTPLFDLKERTVELVAGINYRFQEQAENVSDEFMDGQALNFPAFQPVNQTRDIASVYAETVLPLYPGFDIQMAGRYEHYSDFGGQFSPKLAMRWQATNQVMLRASYTESFKPPNFDQLGGPQIPGFAFVRDPIRCDDQPTNVDCRRPIETLSGGNPDLTPHIGETKTFAIIYVPEQIPDLAINLSYWQFDIEDIVSGYSIPFLLENLIDSDRIIREPASAEDVASGLPGPISQIVLGPINFSRQQTKGLDFSAVYTLQTRKHGDFRFKFDGTYNDEYTFVSPLDNRATNQAGDFEFPRLKATLSGNWNKEKWHGFIFLNYVSGGRRFNTYENGIETDMPFDTGSVTTLGMSFSYQFDDELNFALGCQNCLDKDLLKGPDGFYLLNYANPRGQVWNASLRYSF